MFYELEFISWALHPLPTGQMESSSNLVCVLTKYWIFGPMPKYLAPWWARIQGFQALTE